MTNERSSLCECGHPKEAHGPQEYPGRSGETKACRATIYENSPTPRFAYPCKCQWFKAAK